MSGKELELEEKKSPKKLIIIVAAVVVLLAGGAAAFFLMGGKSEGGKEAHEPKKEEAHAPSVALYLEITPNFLANLPPSNGPYKHVQTTIHLMGKDQAMIDFVKANDPMFRHHILNLLGSQDPNELKTRAGKEKLLTAILEKIHEVAEGLGQHGKIEKVYVSKFVMQ